MSGPVIRQAKRRCGSESASSYLVLDESVAIAIVIALVKAAILEHRYASAERLLELDNTGEFLIESFSFLDAVDIGPQRFGQIDCGEYLHGPLSMLP